MLFSRKGKKVHVRSDAKPWTIRLTGNGLTYLSRMTFQNELERIGLSDRKGEWMTIVEMMKALDGTGMCIAIAGLPVYDVYDICEGNKRLVCLGSPSGEDGAEYGAEEA